MVDLPAARGTLAKQGGDAKARDKMHKDLKKMHKHVQKKMKKTKQDNTMLREENEALKKQTAELEKTLREGDAVVEQAHQDFKAAAAKIKHIKLLQSKVAHLEQIIRTRNNALVQLRSEARTRAELEGERNSAVHAEKSLRKRLSCLTTKYLKLFCQNAALVEKIEEMAEKNELERMGSVVRGELEGLRGEPLKELERFERED